MPSAYQRANFATLLDPVYANNRQTMADAQVAPSMHSTFANYSESNRQAEANGMSAPSMHSMYANLPENNRQALADSQVAPSMHTDIATAELYNQYSKPTNTQGTQIATGPAAAQAGPTFTPVTFNTNDMVKDVEKPRSNLESMTEDIIRRMGSGEWTESLRERQTEATARTTMQNRGAMAQQVAESGLTGQGYGVQAMQGIEQGARQAIADNILSSENASQAAKERAVGLAMTKLTFDETRKRSENEKWWKEFTTLMTVDPVSAAKIYKDNTGQDVDLSSVIDRIEGSDINMARSTARNLMADFSDDAGNADLAFDSSKEYLRRELAHDTGRDVSDVTDAEVRTYFDGLWTPMVNSPSEALYRELYNDQNLKRYFDTPEERKIVADWAAKTMYSGGYDEKTGELKPGWPMPWEDPETSHWFEDLVTGEEWDPSDDADPNNPPSALVQIIRDGQTINVSQNSVRTAYDHYLSNLRETEPAFVPTKEVRQQWLEHYKAGTLDEFDPMRQTNSELYSSVQSDIASSNVEGASRLVMGTGTSANVNEKLTEFLPDILNSIDDGTWEELYPDIYGGEFIDKSVTSDPMGATAINGFWQITTDGKNRTVLSDSGNQFVTDNRGKVVTLWLPGMDQPGSYVVLDKLDDSASNRGTVQPIKLQEVNEDGTVGDVVYFGVDKFREGNDAPAKFISSDYVGTVPVAETIKAGAQEAVRGAGIAGGALMTAGVAPMASPTVAAILGLRALIRRARKRR